MCIKLSNDCKNTILQMMLAVKIKILGKDKRKKTVVSFNTYRVVWQIEIFSTKFVRQHRIQMVASLKLRVFSSVREVAAGFSLTSGYNGLTSSIKSPFQSTSNRIKAVAPNNPPGGGGIRLEFE